MAGSGSQREKDITDPNLLMDGEDPETLVLEDAEHWMGVYGELLGFKDRLLQEAVTAAEELSDDAQQEGERDLSLLDGEKQRLVRRYHYWRARVRTLRQRDEG